MKVLVTGASGFIGSSLLRRLSSEKYQIVGLIHNAEPKFKDKNVKYFSGDITNIESIKPVVEDVDIVFHCAAYVKDYGSWDVFYKINFEGTKNLVHICEKHGIKKFIYLSHLRYESNRNISFYSKTKSMAEDFLMEKYKRDGFPVVVIRPGNVYGPGATIWVLKVLDAIKKNRIALIDNGTGIFLHTYIDNLLDALISAMNTERAIGQTIDITDDDNTITWYDYLTLLAKIVGKPGIKRNFSKNTALFIGKFMIVLHRFFGVEPWVTPTAVEIFTNKEKVSIEKAKKILGYKPKIDYIEGMRRVEQWLKNEDYI